MFPTCFWYWALHNQTRGFINNIGYSHIPATKFLNHLSDLGIDNALGCFGFAPPPPLWQPPKCDRTDNINEIEKIYLPKNEAPISLSKLVTYIFIFLHPESIVFWWFNWDYTQNILPRRSKAPELSYALPHPHFYVIHCMPLIR
jgi:hypothetical protein